MLKLYYRSKTRISSPESIHWIHYACLIDFLALDHSWAQREVAATGIVALSRTTGDRQTFICNGPKWLLSGLRCRHCHRPTIGKCRSIQRNIDGTRNGISLIRWAPNNRLLRSVTSDSFLLRFTRRIMHFNVGITWPLTGFFTACYGIVKEGTS